MDPAKAKEILAAYRPNDKDKDDPMFVEALAEVQSNPNLRAWFLDQQNLDASMALKLAQADVPEDLLDTILKSHAQEHPPRAAIFRRKDLIGLAATVLILLGLMAVYWLPNSLKDSSLSSLSEFEEVMTEFLHEFPRLDLETENHEVVRQWIAKQRAVSEAKIPKGLEQFPPIGCRKIQWRDQETTLVCFMVDGQVVHLFILAESEWPGHGQTEEHQFSKMHSWTTVTWREGNILFLALSRAEVNNLRTVL